MSSCLEDIIWKLYLFFFHMLSRFLIKKSYRLLFADFFLELATGDSTALGRSNLAARLARLVFSSGLVYGSFTTKLCILLVSLMYFGVSESLLVCNSFVLLLLWGTFPFLKVCLFPFLKPAIYRQLNFTLIWTASVFVSILVSKA